MAIIQSGEVAGMVQNIKLAASLLTFTLGFISCLVGLRMVFSRDHRQAMQRLSDRASQFGSRSYDDIGEIPIIESTARLIEAINQLVRTSVGIGVFLCINGLLVCVAAFWLLSKV